MPVYNISGDVLIADDSVFFENMTLDYRFDSASNTYFTVIRVFKTKRDGTKQFPFARTPTLETPYFSALDLAQEEGWNLVVNAWGIFADGIVVENGVVLRNTPATFHSDAIPLTIDENGNLGYAEANADANTLVANGIVSVVTGFCPIVKNFNPAEIPPIGHTSTDDTQKAQRQIIGQFDNGDYAFITCEGRGFNNSDGWTMAQAQTICQSLGLKFAFNMDGGGSTETVIGKKQLNTIYENETGRKCQTFIVFNGKNQFSIPANE